MSVPDLVKASHKAIKVYHAKLKSYEAQNVTHEGAVSTAFQDLLESTTRHKKWTVIPQETIKNNAGKNIRPDATLRDDFRFQRGFWEAKDSHDSLDAEIRKKISAGYPITNTIFEDTQAGVLYQNGAEVFRADLRVSQELCDLLNQFLNYTEPAIDGFEQAVAEFKERVPDLAKGLDKKIKDAHQKNPS